MHLTPASGAITIEQMLLDLTHGGDRVHRLIYVVGQGKRKGQLSEFVGYYGAPRPRAQGHHTTTAPTTERKRKTHLESGTIPMTKFGAQELRTLFIWNIIRYNGKQVI
jgi:hypothetical protein